MRIAVDISLYPLTAAYVPPIRSFIDRLKTHPGLDFEFNALSTQVSGDFGAVFRALEAELRLTFAAPERAVCVMKVLGGGAPPLAQR